MTIEQLADAAGVPVRTVRYYIGEGLIPGPRGRGRAAVYDDEHLSRLRLVRRLVEQRMPIAEIRAWLAGLSPDDVAELLAREEAQAARTAPGTTTPKAYVSALLDRARSRAFVRPPSAPASRAAPAAGAAPATAPAPAAAAPARSAPAAPRAQPAHWTRRELAPGVELHVRADAADRQRDLIRRLVDAAEEAAADRSTQQL